MCSRCLQKSYKCPEPDDSAVLVTGVSSGMGREFALDLVKQGFVVIGTVRKQDDFNRLKEEGQIHPVMLDVSNASHFLEALREVRRILETQNVHLCALVNNAGITGLDKTKELSFVGPEHYDRVMATNVTGVVRATEAFLPLLKEVEGARVVNISSYMGNICPAYPALTSYVASKHAVEGLTDCWRRAFRKQGIAAVLVKPGDFATNMNDIEGAPTDLTPVIKCVRDAVMSARPLARYYTGKVVLAGFSVGFLSRLMSVLPDSLADKLM